MNKKLLIVGLLIYSVIASGNILVLFIGHQVFSEVFVEDNYLIIFPFIMLIGVSLEQFHPFLLNMFVSFFIVILFAPLVWALLKSIILISKYLKQNKISEFSKTNKFTPMDFIKKVEKRTEFDDEKTACYTIRGMLEKDQITGKYVIELTKLPSEDENEVLGDWVSTFKKYDIVFLDNGKKLH